MVEHVEETRERMATIWPIVREHMAEAQTAQARVYNRGAQPREFAPGDRVLVLVPTSECKFLARWNGPYEVIEKVGTVNYRMRQPGRRHPTKVYHVNLLKKWVARDALLCLCSPQQDRKTEPVDVPMGEQLTPNQQQDLLGAGWAVPRCVLHRAGVYRPHTAPHHHGTREEGQIEAVPDPRSTEGGHFSGSAENADGGESCHIANGVAP